MTSTSTVLSVRHGVQSVAGRLKAKLSEPGHRRRRTDARTAASNEVRRLGLVRIDLSCRRLTPGALAQAIEALTTHRVQSLDFGGMVLDADAVRQLADALLANASLVELDLFNCGLDSKAVSLLSSALRSHATLRSLTLGCASAEASGDALVELVQGNQVLQSLDLSWTGLGEECLSEIFNALPHTTGLEAIRLRGLRVTPTVASALSAALLRTAGRLLAVDLSGCTVDESDVDRLIDAVAASGLWGFELRGFSLSEQRQTRLEHALTANRSRSSAVDTLSECLPADHGLPRDVCAEILRHIPLDAEGLETVRNMRALVCSLRAGQR